MLSRIPLFPENASTFAGEVDALYFFLIGVSAFFASLIALLVIVFAVRYRRRSPDEIPRPIHGSVKLELAWSIIPFGIAMVMFFWGASVYLHQRTPPSDALDVFVVGKQWMWKLQHMEGRREINELHVPVGKPVRLTMTSEDVIHSFYVPAFRIKQDVLPGRYTTVWFEATKPGEYHLFCTEYCGTEHSKMIGQVVVMEPGDYQDWLAAADSDGSMAVASAGERLFVQHSCGSCHRETATALGPSLTGLYESDVELADGGTVTADESYLRESILNPQAKLVAGYRPVMPTFQGQISEEGVLQIIQYIKGMEPPPAEESAHASAEH